MSFLTIVEFISMLTVCGLTVWTFKRQKNVDADVFFYASFMIYLLVAEVAVYVIFQFV